MTLSGPNTHLLGCAIFRRESSAGCDCRDRLPHDADLKPHDPAQCVNDYLSSEEAERELAGLLPVALAGQLGYVREYARTILKEWRALRVGGQS